jgi:hypothetical protein
MTEDEFGLRVVRALGFTAGNKEARIHWMLDPEAGAVVVKTPNVLWPRFWPIGSGQICIGVGASPIQACLSSSSSTLHLLGLMTSRKIQSASLQACETKLRDFTEGGFLVHRSRKERRRNRNPGRTKRRQTSAEGHPTSDPPADSQSGVDDAISDDVSFFRIHRDCAIFSPEFRHR